MTNARARRRDERGAVAVVTAITATLVLAVAALTVDLGNTWARRGQLQVQADRAATYAASFLPAHDPTTRTTVAKAVAYYLACHPVVGQTATVGGVARPACPSDPQSATLNPYATQLLAAQLVSFPARNQVRVVTPTARVEFGFGKVAGSDGTDQQMDATARVTSPGLLAPIGITLDCLLNPFANSVGATPLPFGFVTTTHRTSGTEPAAPPLSTPTSGSPTEIGIDPAQVMQSLIPTGTLTVRISGRSWPDRGPLLPGKTYAAVFKRGGATHTSTFTVGGWTAASSGSNPQNRGYIDVPLPLGVRSTVGTWHVQVVTKSGLLGGLTYSSDRTTLDVVSPYPDVRGCGRLLKSPRGENQSNANMALNFQEGIDHLLTTYPTLVSSEPTNLTDLRTLFGLTQCASSNPATIKDLVHPPGTPNCVVTDMSNAYEAGFTEGLIGANGRMTCVGSHPCTPGRTFTLNSRTINNDRFTDYVKNTSLLTHSTFFGINSFLSTGTPVVTPTSNLERDIYNSGRFMWVPVISTLTATSAVAAGDYPILTFRPIFITQGDDVLRTLPLLDTSLLNTGLTGSAAIDAVDGFMRQGLPGVDHNGLIMDGDQVAAARYLTISPDALPAVPADYAGPEADYLGVGPRIIRLVE